MNRLVPNEKETIIEFANAFALYYEKRRKERWVNLGLFFVACPLFYH